MKKALLLVGLGAVGYVLWHRAAHEREERSIWAEVAASFNEYPDPSRNEVHITRLP